MDTALEIYAHGQKLLVQKHVIERAVRALGGNQYLEALALIRGAFADDEGAQASLSDAKLIFAAIWM